MARIFKGGYGVNIEFDDEVARLFDELVARSEDLSVPMRTVAEKLLEGVKLNFSTRADGTWKPISKATILRSQFADKRSGGRPPGLPSTPLFRPALTQANKIFRALRDSFEFRSGKFTAKATSYHPLAHIHDRGTKHFKTGATHVPARPFMFIRKGLDDEAVEIISSYMLGYMFGNGE